MLFDQEEDKNRENDKIHERRIIVMKKRRNLVLSFAALALAVIFVCGLQGEIVYGKKPEQSKKLIFEAPYELTETMVHFVANEATFVDEKAAKAALEPVAKVILAHPGHSVLLAGTTATWGSQKTSVELSLKRAGAVKDLLVKYYDVPAKQLLTIGLGYEDDPFERGQDIDKNGRFVESEGAKNRRVFVLDAEDPIAVKLLK